MKNTLLWGALSTLICTQAHALDAQQPTNTKTPEQTPLQMLQQAPPPATQSQTAPAAQGQTAPATQGQTATTPQGQTAPAAQGQTATTPQGQTANAQQATQPIDCNYKITPETKIIDQSLVLAWSEKATTQAFSFTPDQVTNQVEQLKNCFTEQGWEGFHSALEKSGNLEAIKNQKLNVSSQVDGQTQFSDMKDNQWKLILPLQVVYQNDKEKVTQLLDVQLTVGRKITGELGILQMIATPRPQQQTPTTAPGTNQPASGAAQQSTTAPTSSPATPGTSPTAPGATQASPVTTPKS